MALLLTLYVQKIDELTITMFKPTRLEYIIDSNPRDVAQGGSPPMRRPHGGTPMGDVKVGREKENVAVGRKKAIRGRKREENRRVG